MKINHKKLIKTTIVTLIVFFIISAVFVLLFFTGSPNKNFVLGVDFNIQQAKDLQLDWYKTYLAMLDELQVKNIRLSAPWDSIEPAKDKWDFNDLDLMIKEAEKRDVKIILAIGRRTPRWPECHDPVWLSQFSDKIVRDRQLLMLQKVVERYKNNSAIEMWQVENEPLFDAFGVCPESDVNFLRKEVAFVKSIDDRPVLITDSGELSLWFEAAQIGDYFGTTMYRVTYNSILGYFYYHLPPIFYRVKAWLVGKDLDKIFISELQAEPWAPSGILNTDLDEQKVSMDHDRFVSHINYAKKTGFKATYLWGVEWWYWLKEQKNEPEIWQEAEIMFAKYR